MQKSKFLRKVSFLVIFLFCVTTFWTPVSVVKAGNIKTLTITFATDPTHATATKAQLKYNKNFALSYSFDDGLTRGYDTAFKYMNGGYSDYLGQYFGGLYFTDGAGNNVPFRGSYAFYARNGNYSDIHVNTPSYITWTELQDAVDNGWNVLNHGYTSSSLLPGDPNDEYYVGDPGNHTVGPLDYAYELTQENVEVASHINLKNNNGVVLAPLNMSQVVLPNGDNNYIQPAFDNGFKSVFSQDSVFPFDGNTVTVPDYINVTNPISVNRYVMSRWFDYETRYLTGGANPGGLLNYVDDLANQSTGSTKLWAQEFTHQITTSTYAPDANGGMTWNSWKSLMDYIENTYGRFGDDNVWVAGTEEVYNYIMVKQNSVLSQNLVGNQLTVEIDTTNIPTGLTNYALSLLIDSDATMSSINYGTDFTYHTDNKTTGLINLDWGDNSYSKNDITRVESLVSTAESSKRKSDIDTARIYANLLTTNPTSIKTAYISRLDAIVVPLRTWYIKIRGNITNEGDCSASSNSGTYLSSEYNWNSFYVGRDSLLCSDLTNLKDSDSQSSTFSLSNTAPFSGGLPSDYSGNLGIYPDAVLDSGASLYNGSEIPAKIKISGLEDTKTYNIKLLGNTSSDLNENDRDYTDYTIGETTKSLFVTDNMSNTVEFLDVSPVNGEIEISVVSKNPNWGYGMLNAMEIKENLLTAPSSLSYNSPNVYTKNTIISSLVPTVIGQGITYSISPSLPSGLSLDTLTGIISGTPTETSGLATYTVTATNSGGSTTFGVVITVNNATPTSLSYTSPNVYPKNTAITPLSPTVTGQGITYSVYPTLPTGLSLDVDTGIISGTPTAATILATYTVTAVNSGGSTTSGIDITVNDISNDKPKSSHISGSGSYISRIPVIIFPLQPDTTSNTPICSNGDLFSTLTGEPCSTIVNSPLNITRDLKFKMRGDDVKALQLFLINQNKGPNSRILSKNGATFYFGKLTEKALAEWQKVNEVYPSVGYFGNKTRAKIKLLNL